jgi:hypothetical protein
MTRKVNTPSTTLIRFDTPQQFIGMAINKRAVAAKCVGFIPYQRKDGVNTFLLEWELICQITNKMVYKTTSINMRIGDIPSEIGKDDEPT